jgi:predicted ATPase
MIILNQRNETAGITSEIRTIRPVAYKMDTLIKGLAYYAKEIKPEFVIDKYNEEVIRSLVLYFMRDPEFEKCGNNYSLLKGLLVRGTVGTGKTLLMKAFDRLMKKMGQEDCLFVIVPARTIERDYAEEGSKVILNYGKFSYTRQGSERVYCFDDLGLESHDSKHYGNDMKVMAEILMDRYDLGLKTHATTNLAPAAINEYYGERILSRMREMFNDIRLEGPDRRKK